MELNRDRNTFRRVFDEDADLYDRVRPGYPEPLFDDLIELSGIPPEGSVLEIGCGTGQATLPLARRGYRVVCIELGEALAAVARRNLAEFPEARVVTTPFESWDTDDYFDLVVAATSWHWIAPEVRCAKAASALRPTGSLAIITTHHDFPGDADPFFTEIQDVYDAIGEGHPVWPPRPEDLDDLVGELNASGFFGAVEVRRYNWLQKYTADEYIDLTSTYSNHRLMDESKRKFLFDEIRKRIAARPHKQVTKHYLNVLFVARLRA